MNRRSVLSILVLAGLTATLASAADKPNFTGTWKLNVGKSDFGPIPPPEKMERTIKHDDPKMSVSTLNVGAQGEMKSDVTYTTDGKDSINKTNGMEVKAVVAWDGNKLVLKSKREMQGMEITSVDTWTLSDDGKVLTSVVALSTPQGDFTLTAVMEKQ